MILPPIHDWGSEVVQPFPLNNIGQNKFSRAGRIVAARETFLSRDPDEVANAQFAAFERDLKNNLKLTVEPKCLIYCPNWWRERILWKIEGAFMSLSINDENFILNVSLTELGSPSITLTSHFRLTISWREI